MDDQLYSVITCFYNTTSKTERQAAERELHRIQGEASIWHLFPSWFQDGRPYCDMFAAQTLHVKINKNLEQLDDPASLKSSIDLWIRLSGSPSVKSKLNQALAALLAKTEKHPVDCALGNIELLSILPEECEKVLTLYALRHELRASAIKAIESIGSVPVDELWMECIKSWSMYLDQIPTWLVEVIQHHMKEHLSLGIDILCIWFTKKGTEGLLRLLPTITSAYSEEEIGEVTRLYAAYGEHHADYLCFEPQESFFTNALHLTGAITCRSEFGDPLLVCDIWEFWYSFHQSAIDYERKEVFYSVYTHILQCALQIAKLPERISRRNAIFIREVRREVRDLLSCCLYILGSKQFLALLKSNVHDHVDLESRLWTLNVCSDELEGEDFGELVQLPPIGSHPEIHKQLLALMKKFPKHASIEYILQHLPGYFEHEAARVLDAIVEINEQFIASIYDSVKTLITQTSNGELKVSLCSTFAKLESLPSSQLVSLLESTGTDFFRCASQVVKFCEFSPEICGVILSHFDASPGAYETLTSMVKSFKMDCLPYIHQVLPIAITNSQPSDPGPLVDFFCSIISHIDDKQLAQRVLEHLASINWDADSWICIYDSLTKLAQCNPAWIPVSLVVIGVGLSASLNLPLHRSLVRFYCQLAASSNKQLVVPLTSTLIDVNLELLLKHLAPSQLESSIRMLYELVRLDLRNSQAYLDASLSKFAVDTKWTGRLLTARNYGRFKEACEELGRSHRCIQH